MIKYFLIIFLSISIYPLKTNAWVGAWLGLEAGVAILQGVSEELSGKSTSKSKKGKIICVDQNGQQYYNLPVCPHGMKTIKLNSSYSNTSNNTFINNDKVNSQSKYNKTTYCRNTKTGVIYKTNNALRCGNNSVRSNKAKYDAYQAKYNKNNKNYLTKKNEVSYIYCELKSGKVYETSNNKCYSGAKKITYQEYVKATNNSNSSNKSSYITKKDSSSNSSGEKYVTQKFSYCKLPNGKVYRTGGKCNSASKVITEQEYLVLKDGSNSSNKNNYITKKNNDSSTYCELKSGKVYETSNNKCYSGAFKISEEEYLASNENQDKEIKYVSVDNLRLREYPGGEVILSLPLNSKVLIQSDKTVDKDNYTWVSIVDDTGNFGWVAENFLSSSLNQKVNSSSLLVNFDNSNYLNIIDFIYSNKLNLSQYKYENIEALPSCNNSDYKNNCYGFTNLSSDEVDNPINGCDFKYEGGYKNNVYHGFATYSFYNCEDRNNDYTYVGFIKDGLRYGIGQDELDNRVTIGIFDEDMILGSVKFLDTGGTYFGEFKDNSYTGIGEFKFSTGDSYIGNFKDGKYDGRGIYTFANGKTESGIYKNGDLENTTFINSNEFSINKIKDQYRYLKYEDVIVLNEGVETYYVDNNNSEKQEEYSVSSIKEDIEKVIEDETVQYVQQEEPDIDYLIEDQKTFQTSEDNKPIINVQEYFYTKSQTVLIEGTITDESEIYAVVVHDIRLKADKNGYFQQEINIPIGDHRILVAAADEWGNITETSVKVTRDLDDSLFASQKEILPLDPFKIKTSVNRDDLAIIIGVKEYRDIPDTNFSDNDASYFYDYAQNSLGVHPSNIKSFINSDALIFELFDLDIWLKNKVNENSKVYLFYSGHGMTVDNKSYILPHDFRSSQIERSAFKKDEFLETILQYKPNHLFAFFDACFTGQTRNGELLLASAKNINIAIEDTLKSNLTIFNSSDINEFSTDYDRANHGLFSYFLMKGMEGEADTNNDKSITTNELFSYVKSNVSQSALEFGINQNPSLVSMEDKVLIKW